MENGRRRQIQRGGYATEAEAHEALSAALRSYVQTGPPAKLTAVADAARSHERALRKRRATRQKLRLPGLGTLDPDERIARFNAGQAEAQVEHERHLRELLDGMRPWEEEMVAAAVAEGADAAAAVRAWVFLASWVGRHRVYANDIAYCCRIDESQAIEMWMNYADIPRTDGWRSVERLAHGLLDRP